MPITYLDEEPGKITYLDEAAAEEISPERKALAEEQKQARLAGKLGDMELAARKGVETGAQILSDIFPTTAIAKAGQAIGLQPIVPKEHVKQIREGVTAAIDSIVPRAQVPVDAPNIISPELGKKINEGLTEFGDETLSSFTSPDQATLLASGAKAPEVVGRLFQLGSILSVPEATQSVKEAIKSGDAKEITKAGAGLGMSLAIPAAIQKGLAPKPDAAVPPITGRMLDVPEGAIPKEIGPAGAKGGRLATAPPSELLTSTPPKPTATPADIAKQLGLSRGTETTTGWEFDIIDPKDGKPITFAVPKDSPAEAIDAKAKEFLKSFEKSAPLGEQANPHDILPAFSPVGGEPIPAVKGANHQSIIDAQSMDWKIDNLAESGPDSPRRGFLYKGKFRSREWMRDELRKAGYDVSDRFTSEELDSLQKATPEAKPTEPSKPTEAGLKTTADFERFDDPSGEYIKQPTRKTVISRSTIPGDKPWRLTIFAGPEDMPVAIGHVQLDSPNIIPKDALIELHGQLGRYVRKLSIEGFERQGDQMVRKPSEPAPAAESPKKQRLKVLKSEIEQLAKKGGLTAIEAARFRELNSEANSIRFELAKPLDVSKVGSPQERQSTIPTEIVSVARDDLMRNKDVYDPIIDAAIGVSHDAETSVDLVMMGQNPKVSAQQLYDAFNATREAMRKHYGDTITLFRAVGKQREKPTTNWATTREYAEQFGKNIVSKDVPIDDIIAVNVGISGKYHEVIVGKKPAAPTPPTPPTPTAKEPWEMTREQFDLEKKSRSDARSIVEKESKARQARIAESGQPEGFTHGLLEEKARLEPLVGTHRQHIEQALREGKPVPPEVLSDYPDLAKPTPAPAAEKKGKPFEVDEQLVMRSPHTGEDTIVSYRGKPSEGQAVVWTGKSQFQIPESWLRRQGEEVKLTEPKPTIPTTPTATPKQREPSKMFKAELIDELVGPQMSYETKSQWEARKRKYGQFTKSELASRVASTRASLQHEQQLNSAVQSIIPRVQKLADDSGLAWKSSLRRLADEERVAYHPPADTTKGDAVYTLSRALAEKQLKQPTPPPGTQGLAKIGAEATELESLRKEDVKSDARLDMPGITRKVKPNSLVVQIRDLESLPIRDIVLKSSGDPITDAQLVEKTIRANLHGNASLRESLAVTTGPNGRAVLKFGISPNGMTWAPAKAWIDLVEQAKVQRGETQPKGLPKPPEPPLTGMGGAVPAEFKPTEQTATGIKNATVDQERIARGLPAAIQPLRRSFGEVWDRAMAMIDHDPGVTDALLNDLREKPRALTDVEDALILQRQVDLQNEYGKATRDLAQAFDDGRMDDVTREKLRVSGLSDQLLDLYNIGKKVGTETGRGLNARKMMANEDFSLAQMELAKRSANNGRPLTDAERAELKSLHDRISATQKAYDDYRASTEVKLAQLEAARTIAEIKAKAAPTIDKRILAYAEKIVSGWETEATSAAARLKEKLKPRLGITPEPLDPTIISDAAIWGRAKISRLALDAAKFTDHIVTEFGEGIRPYIDAVWKASNDLINKGLEKVPERVSRSVKKTDLAGAKASTVQIVADKVSKGKRDEVTWYVQKLARTFVENGITDRERLIDEVHSVLQEAIPDITRRQTMDAISGYGDYKQLSKDQITVQLRGMKGEMQQLAKLEDMAAGKPPLKSGVERRTPTEAERQLIKRVNDAKVKFQVPVQDPNTQLKSALDTLKTTLKNRIADYEDRLARKDFAPRPRREIQLDETAARLKAENERVKKRFQEALIADRLKNRTTWEKAMDWGTKYRRSGVLSSPIVIPKLISAALQRLSSVPVEEAIGAGLSKIPGVGKVSAKAPLEGGGWNTKAEMRGFGAAFTKGMSDAYRVLKTGHSDLDLLYGKAGESYTGEYELASKLLAIPGRLHGMIKAPVKRAIFERAVQRMGEFYARQGLDVTDEVVKYRIAVDAYKAGNRSIFLNDNFIASKVTAFISEKTSKETGHATPGSKVFSTAGRIALPIVRVPTNIVAETMQYVGGLVSGNVRLALALRKGVENLTPDQADLIMRELKKGSIGAAVLALGYFNSDAIGGYYQPGKKKQEGDVKWGSIRVNGVDVPSYLLHNPLLETLQVGATIRNVASSKLRNKDTEPQGIAAGIGAAAFGMVEQVPFVREMAELEKARNPYQRGAFMGEQAKSILVPALVQKLAAWTDTTQRAPTNVLQHIQTGIPGLRQSVPPKVVKGAPPVSPPIDYTKPLFPE